MHVTEGDNDKTFSTCPTNVVTTFYKGNSKSQKAIGSRYEIQAILKKDFRLSRPVVPFSERNRLK